MFICIIFHRFISVSLDIIEVMKILICGGGGFIGQHLNRYLDFIDHLTQFRKAIVIPFPIWILKPLLQETAEVLLFSQKMIPTKLFKTTFNFLIQN